MIRAQILIRRATGAGAAALTALGVASAAPPAPTPAAPKPAAPAAAAVSPAKPGGPATPAASTKGLQWIDSYDAALQRAKKERKLVLLDFYTDWCGWCKRLDKDVFSQPSFIQASEGVLAVKINAEKRPDLAQRYQVTSYPKLFFLDADGVTVERIRGYLSLADFTAKVAAVKRGDTEFSRMRNDAMDPTNLPGIYRFAKYLSDDRQHEAGLQYWQQVHDLAMQQLFQNPAAQGPMNYHRDSLIELGRGYAAAGHDDAARKQYDEVLRVYADHAPAAGQALVGLAALEMKKPAGRAKADQYLERVFQEYPGTPAVAEAASLKRSLQAPPLAAAPK